VRPARLEEPDHGNTGQLSGVKGEVTWSYLELIGRV
jgi:hypothetical protein